MPELITPDKIFGSKVIHLKETGSTNEFLMHFSETENTPEGTLVVTEKQNEGRGQKGTQWMSEPGKNITVSYLIKPAFILVNDQFLISKMVALSLHALIRETLNKEFEVKIKWPNDIYVNNHKIAGILIENSLSEGKIKKSVIGIGINVNQTGFPSEFHATSLKLITGFDFSTEELISKLSDHLNFFYYLLKSGNFTAISQKYFAHLYQAGIWCRYILNETVFEGKITGIDPSGKLILEKKDGDFIHAELKEISFLRES